MSTEYVVHTTSRGVQLSVCEHSLYFDLELLRPTDKPDEPEMLDLLLDLEPDEIYQMGLKFLQIASYFPTATIPHSPSEFIKRVAADLKIHI